MNHRTRPLTESVLAVLVAAGFRVGDGDKPNGSGWQGTAGQSNFVAYVVLHNIGALALDGTFDTPSQDAWPLWQLSTYGATRAQSEELADDVREVMLAANLSTLDRAASVVHVEAQGTTARVDDVQPPLYMTPDRYTAFTTS